MLRIATTFVCLIALAFAGCETTTTPSPTPPLTAAVLQAGARQQSDPASLASGRMLFVNRCARCHALPVIGATSAQEWPGIVAAMSKRSGLKGEQSQAVLAYILAAHAVEER